MHSTCFCPLVKFKRHAEKSRAKNLLNQKNVTTS